jgi:hypothetical protein
MLLNSPTPHFDLEVCIRCSLETGELTPGMAAHIHGLATQPSLSKRDRTLLQLLEDALQSGCIRRVGHCSFPLSSDTYDSTSSQSRSN